MYFKQIEEIVDGTKRQTRRVCNPGETAEVALGDTSGQGLVTSGDAFIVYTPGDRMKWCVGRDYAVAPGRGKHGLWWHPETGATKPPGETLGLYRVDSVGGVADGWQPLRIRILEIRREPLQAITEADAIAEGVVCRGCHGNGYYLTGGGDWTGPYEEKCVCDPIGDYRALWESINGRDSWDKCGDVWVLRFEVVR